MGDLSFKPIGEVCIGDEVIGWESRESEGNNAKHFLCKSRVLNVKTKRSKVVKATMSSGRVIRFTPDHVWWRSRYESSSFEYGTVDENMFLARVVNPTEELPTNLVRDAGWLAGLYDGEGHSYCIAQSMAHNPDVCAEIVRVCSRLGIPVTHKKHSSDSGDYYVVTGGRQGYLEFLNKIKPIRTKSLEKKILGTLHVNPRDRIEKLEEDGEEDVFCLSTTTGNYVVWGYASRNTAHHSETVDQVLAWPWLRFERFYEAFSKRRLVESLERRKDSMIASLWSNSNYDDDKGTRKGAIEEIEENFSEIVQVIITGVDINEEEEVDEDNPFFASAKRGLDKIAPVTADNDQATVKDVVDDERMKEFRASIDQ